MISRAVISGRSQWLLIFPEDGVVNDAFKIDFPEELSQVHFIKLRLDDKGKQVGSNFYWRSKDSYEGQDTYGACNFRFLNYRSIAKSKVIG